MLALTTASLRGTTRGIAGQWWVYILKCGSDPPNAGHLRAMFTVQTAQNIRSKLLHKHTHTINAMVAVNSERCESLGLLTRPDRLRCGGTASLQYNSENKTVSVSRGSK